MEIVEKCRDRHETVDSYEKVKRRKPRKVLQLAPLEKSSYLQRRQEMSANVINEEKPITYLQRRHEMLANVIEEKSSDESDVSDESSESESTSESDSSQH